MSKFAQRMTTMEKSASVIRKLFGAMNNPEIISFGDVTPENIRIGAERLGI